MGEAINQWRQRGAVYLWRFKPEKRGLSGWHFAADAQGTQSLAELLDLLMAAEYPVKRTLRLNTPPGSITGIPFSPHRHHKVISPVAIRLTFVPTDSEDRWHVEEDGDHVVLGLGAAGIAELADAVRLYQKGENDFSIGPPEAGRPQNIWFW